MHVLKRTDCRCCRSKKLVEVFNLGPQPFANAFLSRPDQPEETSPLTLMECAACGHVQLKHVADAGDLYREYSFLTSSSQRMADHFAELMRVNLRRFVGHCGLVVEIGSNDGTALASIEREDVHRLGIDPAKNLAVLARERGVPTVSSFFNERTALSVAAEFGQADLIVSANVLGHVDDLDNFCRGINALLKDDGAWIVEVPDVEKLIEQTVMDSIYHEHLSYFSVRSLETLCDRHDLSIHLVEPQDVHGGSLRLTIRRGAQTRRLAEPSVRDWPAFTARCESLRRHLVRWLRDEREAGRTVWGYCAAAKATVLLNYCSIGTDLMPVVVDSTPTKQGRYMPGTHQAILDPVELDRQKPAAAVVLAVNHFAEIARRAEAYTAAGGRIVHPRRLEQFLQHGPWVCKFTVDGVQSGGWFDVFAEDAERIKGWLATAPHVRSVLDCGSLEGGHTAMLARSPGIQRVTGLEARPANLKKARFLHEVLGITNTTFVEANLEHDALAQFPDFDAVWCSGVLYHLLRPVRFLKQLAVGSVFLGTHYAAEPLVTYDGARGWWYQEPGGSRDLLGGLSPKSFWLTLDSLRETVQACGYEITDERTAEKQNGPWVDMMLRK